MSFFQSYRGGRPEVEPHCREAERERTPKRRGVLARSSPFGTRMCGRVTNRLTSQVITVVPAAKNITGRPAGVLGSVVTFPLALIVGFLMLAGLSQVFHAQHFSRTGIHHHIRDGLIVARQPNLIDEKTVLIVELHL